MRPSADLVIVAALASLVAVACSSGTAGDGGGPGVDAGPVDGAQDGEAPCTSDPDCDDGNPCTISTCKVDGVCAQQPRAGEPCDDDDACTQGELCDGDGACAGGAAVETAALPCEICTCDPLGGVTCVAAGAGDGCDDGDCCTSGDQCQVCDPAADAGCPEMALLCGGAPKPCDDEVPCTVDSCSCDEHGVPGCDHVAASDGTPCVADPNVCTQGDSCLGGQCIPADPLPVDDNNPCTEDYCEKGLVVHNPVATGVCDDGDACTTGDSCYFGNCKPGDPVVCVLAPCASDVTCVTGEGCVSTWKPGGAECDDGNPCTLGDECTVDNACAGASGKDCDDLNPCTADACDPATGDCTQSASEALDDLPCVPDVECAQGGWCKDGACVPLGEGSCDDGDPCTKDVCAPGGGCSSTPSGETDGQECESTDPCAVAAACNGGECEITAVDACDDQNPCTTDLCEPGSGCVNTGDEALGVTVDCHQDNAIDDGACCCWQGDPTGANFSAQVLDVGAQPGGTVVDYCIITGFQSGCSSMANIAVSPDGAQWTEVASFPMTSVSKPAGGWEKVCDSVAPGLDFQWIRAGVTNCYVDFFSATVPCSAEDCVGLDGADCDDGNPCTADSCDDLTGCSHAPLESPTCMVLHHAANLVSFSRLPAGSTVGSVLGPITPYVVQILGEGKAAIPLETGDWVGNLRQLERTAGYWIVLDLPDDVTWVALELLGEATDPDVAHQLGKGLNSLAFASDAATPFLDALGPSADLFEFVVGEGIATFHLDTGWVGSLNNLEVNHGYEVSLTDPIANFRFGCVACDGVDPYVYGCTHTPATNFSPAADIDNGSCVYDVPVGWANPGWLANNKPQAFVVLHDLQINGASLEPQDAVGAFVGDVNLGFGYVTGAFAAVPAVNGVEGQEITLRVYDVSEGTVVGVPTGEPVVWSQNKFVLVGCTDPAAANYAPWATVGTDTCK